jgi:glutathione synthase/RimK-type ligase-like ATP-grasp enzyme
MTIAIHKSTWGFSRDWIDYCTRNQIAYKIVDCYSSSIIEMVKDCEVILWHHHHSSRKDVLFAKQLLFALQQSGKKVFPDFNTGWHFDDKVGQKFLLEAVNAPIAKSFVFYTKEDAYQWVETTTFPKVFKLRGGAGSTNVKLIKSKEAAVRIIDRAFGRGFPSYDKWGDLKETLRRFRVGKSNRMELAKSLRRLFYSTQFAKTIGSQKGYVLFQEFAKNNSFDIRVVTIGNRAFAIKRMVRENDFRASGSGFILYDPKEIDERCIRISFDTSRKLKAQVVAYDFVFDGGIPLIVEINYGYAHEAYFKCPGYWDATLNWHEGSFNSADWIIEMMLGSVKNES